MVMMKTSYGIVRVPSAPEKLLIDISKGCCVAGAIEAFCI